MKKRLLFFLLLVSAFSLKISAQISETEPNDNLTDAGVKYITANGSFSGNFTTLDTDIFKIAPGASGTISLTFNSAPSANAIQLFEVGNPVYVASAFVSQTFTYNLNPSVQYYIKTFNGFVTGAWQFSISGLINDGQALDFDGVNDHVIIPAGISLNNKSFTVEFWAKRSTSTTNDYVFGQGPDYTGNSISLHIGFRTNTAFTFAFYSNDLNVVSPAVTDNAYHHWACVYKSGVSGVNRIIYLDGVLLGSDISPNDLLVSNSLDFVIGDAGYYASFPNPFFGQIDELRVWNTARTQCEIQTYMNREIVSDPDLLTGYHLNQGINYANNSTVNTATDGSGNNHTGNLQNFALDNGSSNWIRPGAVTPNFTAPAIPLAEIDISGNATSIPNNNTATGTGNNTDFATMQTRTFVIKNTGTNILNLDTAYITGTGAAQFSITSFPSTTVAASGGTLGFVVKYIPAVGTQTATINILNNDCDEPVYNFVIKGVSSHGGLNFDGVNDYVTCGSVPSASYTTGGATMEAWIRRKANTGGTVMSMANFGVSAAWQLSVTTSGQLVGYINSGSVNSGTATINADEWTHVAMTYNGAVLIVWINGNVVGSGSLGSIAATTAPLMLGACLINGSPAQFFTGDIDNVSFRKGATGVASDMNVELLGNEINLITSFNFNYGTPEQSNLGYTLCPSLPAVNNGTLTNFALTSCPGNWVCGAPALGACSTLREISVTGGTLNIPDGSTLTATANLSSFGSVSVGSVLSRTFVIANSGSGNLNISSTTISGAGAGSFTLVTAPASVLFPGGTSSFVVTFSPSAAGLKTATLTINNDDCDEGTFDFVIDGTGIAPGAALDCSGNGDYISVPHTTALNVGASSDFTSECWIKYTGNALNFAGLICKGVAVSPPGNWHQLMLYNNKLIAELYSNGSGITMSGTSFLNDGSWHHVALVVNRAAKNALLYVDGLVEASTIDPFVSSDFSSPNPLVIGVDRSLGTQYNGAVDEVRIWNTARTQCELQSTMRCEVSASPGLIASYHLNQGFAAAINTTVNTATDATGNGNTGTLNSFALTGTTSNWVAPGGVITGSTTPAVISASIVLTGNSNTITNNSTSASLANFTDFGPALTRTFVVKNNGGGTLTINTPVISGLNASDFSVTILPALAVTTGSTAFEITFSPSAAGTRSAIVSIASNDCTNPLFKFVISGNGSAAALNFDGGQYVSLPLNSPAWDLGNNFSIETWINPTTISGDPVLLYAGQCNSECEAWALSLGPLQSGCGGGGTTGHIIFSAGGLGFVESDYATTLSAWTHVAVTYNGAVMKMYINGVAQNATLATTGTVIPSSHRNIGGDPGCSRFFYTGTLDELRFWNHALCASEINTNMNCQLTSTASGLTANYHFNEGITNADNSTVTSLLDDSNNNITGTLNDFSLLPGPTGNWTGPGAVNSSSLCTPLLVPDITITGNGSYIPTTSTLTSSGNNTSYGSVLVNTALSHTFIIQNTGAGVLNISSSSISGVNASSFSVTASPSTVVASSGSTSFVVTFSTAVAGLKQATLSIYSDDCDENPYIFTLDGTGTAPGAALNFDGIDDHVDIANSASLSFTNAITLEAWIKTTSSSSSEQIITSKHNDSWFLALNGGSAAPGKASFYMNNAAPLGWMYSSTSVNDGNWHHIAGTYDGTTMMLYVDGIVEAQQARTGTLQTGPANAEIGSRGGLNLFEGTMDEVRIWNIARSQCDIRSYMNCEIVTTPTGLVANYHFNQGVASNVNTTQSSLIDAGSVNTGTLSGFALSGPTSNWVSPGAVTTGSATPNAPTATLNILGNSALIAYGNTSPTTSNFTDFGSALTRTFVAKNAAGSGTLYINAITFSGANAADFSVSALPSASLTGNGTSNFVIAFAPSVIGSSSAIVNVSSSDCTHPTYSFVITGSVSAASALSFDGVDDFIDFPSTNLSSGNGDYTIEFWTKIKSTQTGHRWIAYWGIQQPGEMVTLGYDGSLGNRIRIHHLGPDLIANTASIPTGVWTHVAVTYKGATNSNDIYINGNYIETLTFAVPLNIQANPPLQLGSFNSGLYATDIELDEFRAWNIARSQCEIQAYMPAEITSTASGLVSNFHFNQGIPSGANTAVLTLTDAATGLNGTLTSFDLTQGNSTSNWVSPGGVISGNTVAIVSTDEINILGGSGVTINDNTTSTSLTDNTNFGGVCINTGVTKTYTIQNTGGSALSVNSLSLTGANATMFSLNATPGSISAGGSATFAITFSPTVSSTASAGIVIYSSDCDEATYDFVITGSVNASPTITTSNGLICQGQSYTLTASGANTYTYSTGPVVSPLSTTNYSITGTSTAGCVSSNTAVAQVVVDAIPNVSIAGSSTLCSSGSTTFSASGANTYTWSNSATGSLVTLSPTLTTTYTVTGAYANGCANTAVKTLSVYTTPTIAVNSGTICFGSSFTITPSGTNTYSYVNGGPVVSPTTTTSYSVTGTSSSGCTSAPASISNVTVIALPTVSVSNYTICNGSTATLSPSGAVSYNFQGGSASVSPTTTTSYTVSGANAQGCVNTATSVVTVNAVPALTISASSASICNGSAGTLTVSGANNYVWSTSATTSIISVSPSSNTTYTVTGTGANGCTITASQPLFVNPLPTITVNSGAICPGNSYTFNPSGATNYTYSTGPVITPAASANYTITGSSAQGCLGAAAIATVNVINTLTVSVTGNTTICEGQSTILTANGASTYSWSNGINTASVILSPTVNTTYTVYGASGTCSNTAVVSVSVNAAPGVSVTSGAICAGGSFTMVSSGASTYTYSSGSAIVNPVTTTTYSVSGTNAIGCVSTASAISTVTVNALPILTITATSNTVCAGATATLTASGATSYTWNTNALTNTIAVSPAANISYTASGTGTNGCVGSVSQAIVVNPLPTVTVPNGTICPGNSFTLNPSGAATYSYSSGPVVNPSSTTTYSVRGISAQGCLSAADGVGTVSVINSVTITVTGNTLICNGQAASLTASGATTYSWTSGSLSNTATVSPVANTTYTVYGVSGTCSNTAVVQVSVNAVPTITVNSGAICSGNSFTMNPGGAVTYTYSSGSAIISPVATTSYSVSGTNAAGCVSTASAISNVTVNASPTLAIASPTSVCEGSPVTLTVSGANTYLWSNTSTATTITVTPSVNNSYSITGTDLNGCSSTASQSIHIDPLPTITVNSGAVCPGNSFTISPSGAASYTVSGGVFTVTPVNPVSTYSVSGTSAQGCVSASLAVATVSVVHNLTISVTGNTAVCSGQSTTLTAGGASTYSWSTGATTNTVVLTPTGLTDYTVYGASGTCSDVTIVTLTVNASPVIAVNGGTVCSGSGFTLSPSGGISYTYTSGSASVNPTITTTYSITGEDALGCISSNTAVAEVTVVALPTVTAAISDATVCAGSTTSLSAGGATAYVWNTAQTSATIVITPTSTTVYSVTGTDANGCQNTATINANVTAAPGLTLSTTSATICKGDTISLTAYGAASYSWSGGITNGTVFTPTLSADYTVTATAANGCSVSATAGVTVTSGITLTVTSSEATTCLGNAVTLNAFGANTYTWSTLQTNASISIQPTLADNVYTVNGRTTGGCVATMSFTQAVTVCDKDTAIHLFTGFTPNGDGHNDTWIIKNIEYYKGSTVSVFNRWGVEVFKAQNYNNTWPNEDELKKLSASTYYYIIDLNNGSKPLKGWLEVIKND